MEDISSLIERLNITLTHSAIPEEELKASSFILIRHGYSLYNFEDQKIMEQFGEDSKQAQELKIDPTMTDPGLHQIGILQCESNQELVNVINFKVVFVSPMQRAIQTAIHMFKKHPNKQNIQFIVLPIVREVLETSNDIQPDVEEIVRKYAPGEAICEGLNFNFAMIYLYGIPQLWQIYTVANLAKQKDMILSLRKDDNGQINVLDVILQRQAAHHPRYENHHDLFERARIIKTFMREYIIANPLDQSTQEKYAIVSHSRIIATLTASGVGEDDSLLDYQWFKNCEMRPFSNY
eukprot:403369316